MKKFLGSVLMIAAGVGGFLWWKRKQVIVANEVAADPWPAAVGSSPDVAQAQAPTDTGTPKVAPAAKKVEAKKAPVKKSAAKKATPKPPRPSEPKPE